MNEHRDSHAPDQALLDGEARRDELSNGEFLEAAFREPSEQAWFLYDDDYEPAMEHEIESRFAIGNGVLGVRASLDQPTSLSRPRTYVAGLFQPPEAAAQVPALYIAPDWISLNVWVNGEAVSLDGGITIQHRRLLDFRRGVLLNTLRHRTESGIETIVRSVRFASLAEAEIAAQLAAIEVSQAAQLRLEVGIATESGDLQAATADEPVIVNVPGAGTALAVSAKVSLIVDGQTVPASHGQPAGAGLYWESRAGQMAELRRVVAFATANSPEVAKERVRTSIAAADSFPGVYARHVREWERRWSLSDITIEGDEQSQQALRFAIYHLISATPRSDHISVGARALTGDAYKGHVFWDTEIFLLPFYTFTRPQAARAMLMYRFYTLPAARRKAASFGYRGALYAWESTDTGEETTPPFALSPRGEVVAIHSGTREQHISADVAYAVWRYWQATDDAEFLIDAGAEIILETSRFWASRAAMEGDGKYHIRHVIGPDEYHEDVDDNAYTNVMASFNLECGLEVARLMERRWPEQWKALSQRLSLTQGEFHSWDAVRGDLVTGFDPESGLFEQFEGFFSYEDIDLTAYAARTGPMDELLGRERTSRSQVIKQADVVMLLALLGERYDERIRSANFRYYEPRTGHGSSLSPPVHATVAARLGLVELAKQLFDDTAAIDLSDTLGNTSGGVHIGALGGLWQIAVFGFAGVQPYGTELTIGPHLPAGWAQIAFQIQWRRRLLRISIEGEGSIVSVSLERGDDLPVQLGSLRHRVHGGETWRCMRTPGGAWREAQDE